MRGCYPGLQRTHLAHVLLAGEGVDHAARGKEEQALEEGVRREMEDACREGPHAESEEHVPELADSGIGNDTLDIILHQPDGRGKDGR